MKHSAISFYFTLSLWIGLAAGLILLFLWIKKIYRPLVKKMERQKSVSIKYAGFMSFLYMLPGILLFIACVIPAFYFNNLLKREEYCIELIKANKGITRDDPDVKTRCKCLNTEELFEKAKN